MSSAGTVPISTANVIGNKTFLAYSSNNTLLDLLNTEIFFYIRFIISNSVLPNHLFVCFFHNISEFPTSMHI